MSIYIIARNAQDTIGQCLESCKDFADEIILLTNDSTDKTIDIARSYGVKSFENEWVCYRDQKAFALNLCSSEWVLNLDSDECMSLELKSSINDFLNSSLSKKFSGVSFNRKSYFLGKWIEHGDWYPDAKIRLSKKSLSRWGGSEEHDLLKVDGRVLHLKGNLLHYSYRDINHLINKSLYFSDLFVKRIVLVDDCRKKSLFEIILRSFGRFFRAYFLKLGFLDGYQGLLIAVNSSFFVFIKYIKLNFNKR